MTPRTVFVTTSAGLRRVQKGVKLDYCESTKSKWRIVASIRNATYFSLQGPLCLRNNQGTIQFYTECTELSDLSMFWKLRFPVRISIPGRNLTVGGVEQFRTF